MGHDFFTPLNTQAIVVELPNAALGGNGADIGVWATTRKGEMPVDQMGRPAINTVFNGTPAAKEAFNATRPNKQRTAMGGLFRNNVINTLLAFSALDPTNPAYTQAQAAGLADVLLPDLLTYKVGTVAAGPLNGRGLADDVIDAELNIVTGGYPFPGRDAIGGSPGPRRPAHRLHRELPVPRGAALTALGGVASASPLRRTLAPHARPAHTKATDR